jgi:serine/threonine protein kinase
MTLPARQMEPASSRFELLGILGEGGSGIVYEAVVHGAPLGGDEAVPRRVALKVLRSELETSAREHKKFLAEAERMQRLSAPGLVKLLEAGTLPDGRPYLAMPVLRGETLSACLRRGAVPASVALRWFDLLAQAVEAIHQAGMVHRDIKPENIFIVNDSPVLLDFGIARDINDHRTTTTVEGRVRGTPAYMAPERFFGAQATVASDVYELAVVLYAMLVGKLPWGSDASVSERLSPKSPLEAGANISRAAATVILSALSTRPEKRPLSAAVFAREVAAASQGFEGKHRVVLDSSSFPDAETARVTALVDVPVASAGGLSRRWIALGAAIAGAFAAIVVARGIGGSSASVSSSASPVAVPSSAVPPSAPAPATGSAASAPTSIVPPPPEPSAQIAVPPTSKDSKDLPLPTGTSLPPTRVNVSPEPSRALPTVRSTPSPVPSARPTVSSRPAPSSVYEDRQ